VHKQAEKGSKFEFAAADQKLHLDITGLRFLNGVFDWLYSKSVNGSGKFRNHGLD
jgi:hypothetical protein